MSFELTRMNSETPRIEARDAGGMALLISMLLLTMLTLLGLYVAVNATTEVRISDNFESETRARFAALAGLDHARSALKGLDFDDQLKGPDGVYDLTPSYIDQARGFSFRNPLSWAMARELDILDPSGEIGSLPDDGLLNSGYHAAGPGVILIPQTGIASTVPASGGHGSAIASRYFVKVTDNNGESSEVSGDPSNNPFVDGDGVVIVRSMGVATTVREWAGSTARRNSVVVFEARFKRRATFDQDAALLVQGLDIRPSASVMFEGESFSITGTVEAPGIGTVETDSERHGIADRIRSMVGPGQSDRIQGAGGSNSIRDVTGSIDSMPDRAVILDKDFLYDFIQHMVPRLADSSFGGSQNWNGITAPDLGAYDSRLPPGAPGQRPRITFVDGDLGIEGVGGGGLLVVTGKLTVSGNFAFSGLILLVGKGDLEARGSACVITGGIYAAGISNSGEQLNWEAVRLTVGRYCEMRFDPRMIRMAESLIPPLQVGFREVTTAMDP